MHSFHSLLSIGFDKNGEVDFRVEIQGISNLSKEKMREFVEMIPWAVAAALETYKEQAISRIPQGSDQPIPDIPS